MGLAAGADHRPTTRGVTLGNPETSLTLRAAELLAAGPADAQTLVSYVCQLPGAPRNIAEHMATALFAGHSAFARDATGRWLLAGVVRDADVVVKSLEDEAYVVVDVEATGTSATKGDRVIEVAAVRVHGGRAKTVFDSLINPQRPIPRYVGQLTNITWEMVRRAPTFADVCDELLAVLDGHIFVGHNVEFDWRFLSMEVQRVTARRLHGRRLCTARMARKLLPGLRRRSLDHVSMHFGIENRARHRAGGDAEATATALVRMFKAARSQGCSTFADLEQLLAGTPAPGGKRRKRRRSLPHSVTDDTTA